MFSQYLSAIEGVAAYPIFSLMIFVPFFLIVTIWIFRLDKSYLNHMSKLPLENSEEKPSAGDERS